MKRTLVLLLILLALGGITWYTLKTKSTKEFMPVSNSLYAIDDIGRVQKAGIIQSDGTKYVFDRTPKGWTVNGQKANASVVNTMLNTVKKLRILYATPESAKPTMLKSLATNRTKVELYDKENRLLQKFYVGTTSNDGNSTYFIKEDSNEPHLVGIPNFQGVVMHNFNRPESDWLSKTVFEFQPDEIAGVSIEYPNLKNHSFRLSKEKGLFEVKPFYAINPISPKGKRVGAIKTFLSFFEKIGAESLEPNILLQDSLNTLVPFAIVKIKDANQKEHISKFYPYLPTGVTAIEYLGAPDRDETSPIGVNRYFVINEEKKCFLTQQRVIGKVLWAYKDFFSK